MYPWSNWGAVLTADAVATDEVINLFDLLPFTNNITSANFGTSLTGSSRGSFVQWSNCPALEDAVN